MFSSNMKPESKHVERPKHTSTSKSAMSNPRSSVYSPKSKIKEPKESMTPKKRNWTRKCHNSAAREAGFKNSEDVLKNMISRNK